MRRMDERRTATADLPHPADLACSNGLGGEAPAQPITDPDLAEVVATWPRMRHQIRQAVLRLADLSRDIDGA